MTFSELYVGQKASVQKTFTAADVTAFAGISLDVNPIHMSDKYAESTVFGKRIVHGILTSGLISAVLANKLPGPGTIYLGQELRFTAPVFLGDDITAEVEVAMNPRTLSVSGINTLELLEKINIDLAFIGVSGCSGEVGFTCGTEADMQIKRLVIRKARTSVVLCGADKFKRLMPFTFAKISDVDYVISDEPLPEDFVRSCEENGVKIL